MLSISGVEQSQACLKSAEPARVSQLVAGEWQPTPTGCDVVYDAPDAAPLCSVSQSSPFDLERAAKASTEAFRGWRGTTSTTRSRLLTRASELLAARADEIALELVLQTGKPIAQAEGEIARAVESLEHYAAVAATESAQAIDRHSSRALVLELSEPVGPAGIISSWNMPVQLLCQKAGAALAAGCTIVVVSHPRAPLAALRFAEVLYEAGFPSGVVQLLHGGAELSAALATHRLIRIVSVTGSEETGRAVLREVADQMKRVVLELGGKSANVVFADADLSKAADGIVAGFTRNQGAACTAGSRVLVHKSVIDEVRQAIYNRLDALIVGDPFNRKTAVGALRDEFAAARMQRILQSATEAGAYVYGGTKLSVCGRRGSYVRPALIEGAPADHEVHRRELFLPIATLSSFSDEEDAVRQANDTDYGLAAGLWSGDFARCRRVWEQLDAGVIYVNGYHRIDGIPYATEGRGLSGFGAECGAAGVAAFLIPKSVQLAC